MHKRECPALVKWATSVLSTVTTASGSSVSLPTIPSDAVRCLARIIWGQKMAGLDSSWVCSILSCVSLSLNFIPKTREIDGLQARTLYKVKFSVQM